MWRRHPGCGRLGSLHHSIRLAPPKPHERGAMKHTPPVSALFMLSLTRLPAAERPNILWRVCEDSNVNWIGCYGNPEAKTPNIDAFAKQSFRYTHVYASAPVCAAQRSTWITGINSLSMGTHPMRS